MLVATSVFTAVLKFHVVAGAVGLGVGPIAMFARKQRGIHTRAGSLYHWAVFFVCLSGLLLAILDWTGAGYLFFVALFSYSFALRGFLAAKRKRQGWQAAHISGMLGSYIAMITALLIVNRESVPGLRALPPLISWILPTVIGTPLISLVQRTFRTQAPGNSQLKGM